MRTNPSRGPIQEFLKHALRGEPIREPGGDFAASFTYVKDVAAGLLATYRAEQLRFGTYHLGHGRNFSAFEVADAVRALVPGCKFDLGGETEPTYNVMRGPCWRSIRRPPRTVRRTKAARGK